MNVEQFIVGFNARIYKIYELQINEKLREYLILRQAELDPNSRNTIFDADSG